jgi:DNA-binding MarR family transcriptional regulator
MDRHSYHTFQVLDHIEKTPLLTNRRAADKLKVSVKLAHELLSQIVQKGWVHIHKHHSRRWDYFLTPKGIAEKARLTYEFMEFTMQFYREARRRSSEVLAHARKAGVSRVAFLGVSELTEISFLGIQEQKLQLVDIFDDVHAGQEFLGVKVRPLADLPSSTAETILVTVCDPALPMGRNFLPADVPAATDGQGRPHADPRLIWVFGAPEENNPTPPSPPPAPPPKKNEEVQNPVSPPASRNEEHP